MTWKKLIGLGVMIPLSFFLANHSHASVRSDVLKSLNEAMAFGRMFPPGTKTVTEAEHLRAEEHLVNSLKYGMRPSQSELESVFSENFAFEWKLYMQAIRNRLEGWRNPNVTLSIQGANGIERFRDYYNKNRQWFNDKLNTNEESSWFSWNPKKGELLPRIGCEKGVVIAFLAGC